MIKDFDTSKIIFENQHKTPYSVRYKPWVVDSKFTPEKLNILKKLTSVECYRMFFHRYYDEPNENINGLCTLHLIKPTSVTLTYDEIARWLDIGVAHNMLPPNINADSCITPDDKEKDWYYARAVMHCEGIPQGMLYLYLNTFRELYEDPGFVKAVLYLHDTLGINYYAAYVIGSFFNKVGMGHHSIPITRSISIYNASKTGTIVSLKSVVPNADYSKLDMNIVRALFRFVTDDSVDRGLPILKTNKKNVNRATGWSCTSRIKELFEEDLKKQGQLLLPVQHLDNENVDLLIKSPKKKVAKILEGILKEKK